jgi:hypothetical protein
MERLLLVRCRISIRLSTVSIDSFPNDNKKIFKRPTKKRRCPASHWVIAGRYQQSIKSRAYAARLFICGFIASPRKWEIADLQSL